MGNTDKNLLVLLGKRIRYLRKAKGWTQQDLGEKADMNYKFLGEVERGKHNPSFGILSKIANTLNIELMELCRFDHELTSRKELENEIIKILKNSSEDELRQSLLLLKALFPLNREKSRE